MRKDQEHVNDYNKKSQNVFLDYSLETTQKCC